MITREDRLTALVRQIERLERRAQRLSQASKRYWSFKLWIFLVTTGALIVGLLLFRWPGALFLPAGLGAFIVAGYYHRKIDKSYADTSVLLASKKIQIARMRLDWDALPQPLESEEVDHPFEADLDIMGERSLHRLLNTAVSTKGHALHATRSKLWNWPVCPPAGKHRYEPSLMFLHVQKAIVSVNGAGLLACAVVGPLPGHGQGTTHRRRPAAPLHSQMRMKGKRNKRGRHFVNAIILKNQG